MFFKIILVVALNIFSTIFAQDRFDFYLRDNNNKAVSFDTFFKNAVKQREALIFFQTTCMPCLEEIKYLSTYLSDEEKKQIKLINVNESLKEVLKFCSRNEIEFPVLFDKYSLAKKSLKIIKIPSVIFPRRNKNILWEGTDFERIKREFKQNINKI